MIKLVKIISVYKSGFRKWVRIGSKWQRVPAPVKKGYCRVMAIIKFNNQILTRHIDVREDLCN